MVNNIPFVIEKLKSNQMNSYQEVARIILKYMDKYVPVKTGNLKSHNYTNFSSNGVNAGNTCKYAGFQEYGTSKQSGTPFIRPAVYNHIGEIYQALRRLGDGL